MDREAEVIDRLTKYAAEKVFVVSKTAPSLVRAMLKGEKKKGGLYCPCRVVREDMTGDEKKAILCPCNFCDDEVKEDGECLCGMFEKKKEMKTILPRVL